MNSYESVQRPTVINEAGSFVEPAPKQHPICELGNPNGILAQRSRAEEAYVKMLQLAQSLLGRNGRECRAAGLTQVPEGWDDAVLEQVTGDALLWRRPAPLQKIDLEIEVKKL